MADAQRWMDHYQVKTNVLECTESLGKMYLGFTGGGGCVSVYHVQLMKGRDKEKEM